MLAAVVSLLKHFLAHLMVQQHFEAAEPDYALFAELISRRGSVEILILLLIVAYDRRVMERQMAWLHRFGFAVFIDSNHCVGASEVHAEINHILRFSLQYNKILDSFVVAASEYSLRVGYELIRAFCEYFKLLR